VRTLETFRLLAAALCIAAVAAIPAFAGRPACPEHYYRGVSPDIANPKMKPDARELCYSAFGVVHSGITRTPLWSAEHLTREALSAAGTLVRSDKFHAEARLPPAGRAELADYARSGFDRGHMAPNGDMPDRGAQGESFSLANIVPQDPESNRGVWQRIEKSVRTLAKRRGELYVITGPLFRGGQLRQVGGRVMVPSHLYKVVLDPAEGKAGAYLVENAPTSDYTTMSVAELEAIAGIDFFPGMPPDAKRAMLPLPKPSGSGGRGGKRRSRDEGAESIWREFRSLIR
jgi:endonuclease G